MRNKLDLKERKGVKAKTLELEGDDSIFDGDHVHVPSISDEVGADVLQDQVHVLRRQLEQLGRIDPRRRRPGGGGRHRPIGGGGGEPSLGNSPAALHTKAVGTEEWRTRRRYEKWRRFGNLGTEGGGARSSRQAGGGQRLHGLALAR